MKKSYTSLKLFMMFTFIASLYFLYIFYPLVELNKDHTTPLILTSLALLFGLLTTIYSIRSISKIPSSFTYVEMAKGFLFLAVLFVFIDSYNVTQETQKELCKTISIIGLTLLIFDHFVFSSAVKKYFELKYLGATGALTFQAVAQVLIDGGKLEKVSAYDLTQNVDTYLDSFQSQGKKQIKIVLFSLQYIPIVFFTLPMTWMNAAKRVKFIQKHFTHSEGMLRDLIRGATQLVYLVYYGDPKTWDVTGYIPFEDRPRGKDVKIPKEEKLPVIVPKENMADLHTDILVIGSGAGGAVAAYELAKQTGKNVMIVERGKYFEPEKDFDNIEPTMIGKLYKDGGLQLTQNFDMSILQGEGLGGTTLINNGICFRIPDKVLDKWEDLGAKIDREHLSKIYDTVEKNINMTPIDELVANEGARKLMEGAQKLGIDNAWFNTNFKDCLGCGNCNIGCKYNRKMSMLLNYIPWAVEEGASIVVETAVEKINTTSGKATSVNCKSKSGSSFKIHADHIIVSCGTVASSALLKESGITKNVGSRISFNVASPLHAEFKETLNSYNGTQMCTYLKVDDQLIESTFNPPAASSVIMPGWFEEHFNRMEKYNNLATSSPVVGSEPNGVLKKNIISGYDVDYTMTDSDFALLKKGLKTTCKVLLASGADIVYPSTFDGPKITKESEVDSVIDMIKKPEDVTLSSAHPQGGNPMSDNTEIGAIGTDFKVHGYSNLYVSDASVFPTSVDVNPQLTIMAISNYAADLISAEINQTKKAEVMEEAQ